MFAVEVLDDARYPERCAAHIAAALPGGGSLVLTGGTTIEKVFPYLATARSGWDNVTFAFSDERCVPPDHEASNYGKARRLFLDAANPGAVHRMKGELEPRAAAAEYSQGISGLVAHGFDLLLLGVGADAHIGALYPGSPALDARSSCAAVERPDGLGGLTLTPPAIASARKILLLVTGEAKAAMVARAIASDAPVHECPVRLLADHPDATFLLNPPAAAAL